MEARRGEVTSYPAKSGKLALEPGVAFSPSHHTYCQLYPPSQARFRHVRFSDYVYVGHLQPLIINTCLYWGGLGSFSPKRRKCISVSALQPWSSVRLWAVKGRLKHPGVLGIADHAFTQDWGPDQTESRPAPTMKCWTSGNTLLFYFQIKE